MSRPGSFSFFFRDLMKVFQRERDRESGEEEEEEAAKKSPVVIAMQERSVAFTMPLHYPRYTQADYKEMPEWQLNRLLSQYGLPILEDVAERRSYAMGAFLWNQ